MTCMAAVVTVETIADGVQRGAFPPPFVDFVVLQVGGDYFFAATKVGQLRPGQVVAVTISRSTDEVTLAA